MNGKHIYSALLFVGFCSVLFLFNMQMSLYRESENLNNIENDIVDTTSEKLLKRHESVLSSVEHYLREIYIRMEKSRQNKKQKNYKELLNNRNYKINKLIPASNFIKIKEANITGIDSFHLTVPYREIQLFVLQKYYPLLVENYTFSDATSKEPYIHHIPNEVGGLDFTSSFKEQLNTFRNLEKSNEWVRRSFPKVSQAGSGGNVTLTFVHVMSGATVFGDGAVVKDDVFIHPRGCKRFPKDIQYIQNKYSFAGNSYFDEVFSLALYWGEGFYHATVEDVPRISPYIAFLKKHKHVKVQVRVKTGFIINMLEKLGITKDRIVEGQMNAGILYMPAGTRCGIPSLFNIQLLSNQYKSTVPPVEKSGKLNIVLIKRSKKRFFRRHTDILNLLKGLALTNNARVTIFADNPLPTFDRTLQIFHTADLIVAPHGAGLANVIFSRPETVVIEGLCPNPGLLRPSQAGKLNFCYGDLSYMLGLVHYGITSNINCRKTTPEMVKRPADIYLKWLSQRYNTM